MAHPVMDQRFPLPDLPGVPPSAVSMAPLGPEIHTVIRVFLVNGESRSLPLDDRADVNDIVRFILTRLRVNMDVARQLFGILLKHNNSHECYWLQPGFTVQELLHEYCGLRPLDEWKLMLRVRVMPKTPQHLQSQDPISFQYFYDQVLRSYLEDDNIHVDNDTAVKLGCLELRRFYKDMPQIALKKKENFTMLERDIGLEKFFKKSLLTSVKHSNLRKMVLSAFQQYESLTMEGCVFQFFNLLSKYHAFDTERFTNCAVGDDQTIPLTYEVFVGPNCDIEYKPENGDRRFLAAFSDIQDITYEVELMSRGRVIIDMRGQQPTVVVRTAQLVKAIHLASLIDAYSMVYTANPHSRMTGAGTVTNKRNSSRFSGIYNRIDELTFREPVPVPYATFRSSTEFQGFNNSGEYATVDEAGGTLLGKPISSKEVILDEKIGEGQFGDVHKGVLYPNTHDETMVAIKTCKPDASTEERTKFLEEAAVMRKFSHPHIIKLFGVMSDNAATYIIMELAPYGQLRRYVLTEGSRITPLTLIQYIHQLSMALMHLESLNFVHRDIAARNVLVATHDVIKLADFGLSRGLDDTDYYVASRGKLPIKWMAPESINFRRFTGLSDVWMFGVCCWEILMRGVKPFVGIKNDEVISKIELGERLALPSECPASLFRLMNLCWQYDPQDRPSFVEVEQTVRYIVEEEKQMDSVTHRRSYTGREIIQRDPNAPEKPVRVAGGGLPPMSRVPSDSHMKRLSALSMSSDVDQRMFDERANGPPLPPRAMMRMRDPSMSPPTLPPDSDRGPPKQYRERTPQGQFQVDDQPPPIPIEPYSVTTIAQNNGYEAHIPNPRRSESPLPIPMQAHIPPPSIIRQPPRELESSSSSSDVYYSTPAELAERGSGRALNDEGVFVDRGVHTSVSSADSGKDQGLRPRMGDGRPLSHVSNESSGRNSPVFTGPSKSSPPIEPYSPPDDDPIVMQTTAVVKSVMELSNKVPLSRPNNYVDFVKNVGLSLRDLLGKVDLELKKLPQQTHHEVSMAHKVLSSDMTALVEAMKNAQKNYQTFLEADYQKQMLKAAHVVAVNSKQLLDAVNSARRKAHLMQ